jgi:hypothetical protein
MADMLTFSVDFGLKALTNGKSNENKGATIKVLRAIELCFVSRIGKFSAFGAILL